MSTTTQIKRGTAAAAGAYVALIGELVADTTNTRLSLGDGATAGGVPLAKYSEVQFDKTRTSVASASPLVLTGMTGEYAHVTGTTGFSTITLTDGHTRTLVFDGVLTITPSSTLIVPGNAAITTQAGDVAMVRGEAAGVVRIVEYQKADGTATVSPIVGKLGTPGTAGVMLATTPTDKSQIVGCALSSTQALSITTNGTVYVVNLHDATGAVVNSMTLSTTATSVESAMLPGIVPLTATTAAVTWTDASTSYAQCAVIVSVSGSTLSKGTQVTVQSGLGAASVGNSCAIAWTATKVSFLFYYTNGGAHYYATYTVSGTTLTSLVAPTAFTISVFVPILTTQLDATHALMTYSGNFVGITESSGTLTFTTTTNALTASAAIQGMRAISATRALWIGYVSGGPATVAQIIEFASGAIRFIGRPYLLPALSDNRLYISIEQISAGTYVAFLAYNGCQGYLLPMTVSGEGIAFLDSANVQMGSPLYGGPVMKVGTNLLVVYANGANSGYPTQRLIPLGTVT